MRRLTPLYTPEDAARVLWSLILTERALLEHFDTPPKGHEGDPAKYRNLAREFPGMRDDPRLKSIVENYWTHSGIKPGEGAFPNEYSLPQVETAAELDGVTVYTQDSPIPADLSSDSLGF